MRWTLDTVIWRLCLGHVQVAIRNRDMVRRQAKFDMNKVSTQASVIHGRADVSMANHKPKSGSGVLQSVVNDKPRWGS